MFLTVHNIQDNEEYLLNSNNIISISDYSGTTKIITPFQYFVVKESYEEIKKQLFTPKPFDYPTYVIPLQDWNS